MGYYIRITEGTVTIPKKNIADAYQRMCALNNDDSIKRGGQWGGALSKEDPRPAGLNYHPARWFSWMDANYPETCPTAKSILDSLGFESYEDDEGLTIFGYDSKAGQEDIFMASISDLCAKGSYFTWSGEDGEMWREEFGGPAVITKSAVIHWE